VEEFVGGRELNISLFGYPTAHALPVAEIEFREFPEGLFPIVGYRAKWDKDSFEYQHTLRAFPGDLPPPMLAGIESTALECFRLFMMRDYGRVDIRMDESGRSNVLEVNANCCLSPDAGFSAAIERAGINYSEMVTQFLEFMEQRSGAYDHQACQISRQRRNSAASHTQKGFQRA
jgi:D-alanine-D-alanine ligase